MYNLAICFLPHISTMCTDVFGRSFILFFCHCIFVYIKLYITG
uniref:Uncharacterized protein n=1 Tax=Anguilla anguilla TaxID=7936 RepID=A0A0E9W9Z4_ANGAN